jgi:hypothetical protein
MLPLAFWKLLGSPELSPRGKMLHILLAKESVGAGWGLLAGGAFIFVMRDFTKL